jgi:hypothetical protein
MTSGIKDKNQNNAFIKWKVERQKRLLGSVKVPVVVFLNA